MNNMEQDETGSFPPCKNVKASNTLEWRLNRFRPVPAVPVKHFGPLEVTIRQLEHFGDVAFAVAAREMCLEFFKGAKNQKYYFTFSGRLVTNLNIAGCASRQKASAIEVEVGEVYFTQGWQEAVNEAKRLLKETLVWKEALRLGGAL